MGRHTSLSLTGLHIFGPYLLLVWRSPTVKWGSDAITHVCLRRIEFLSSTLIGLGWGNGQVCHRLSVPGANRSRTKNGSQSAPISPNPITFLWDRWDRFVNLYVAKNPRCGQGSISLNYPHFYGFTGIRGSQCYRIMTKAAKPQLIQAGFLSSNLDISKTDDLLSKKAPFVKRR